MGGHNTLLVPFTSIHTHANVGERKGKLMRRIFEFHCAESLVLQIHIMWRHDQYKTDTSWHEHLDELKEHKQGSGVDSMFLHLKCIIICYMLNITTTAVSEKILHGQSLVWPHH